MVTTHEPTRVLAELTSRAVAEGRELEGLEVRRPTLEDVYFAAIGGRLPAVDADLAVPA